MRRGVGLVNQVQCPLCGDWIDLTKEQYLGKTPITDSCGYLATVNLSLYLRLPT
jgi:hypothetical protein